jgi:hypothetical protein
MGGEEVIDTCLSRLDKWVFRSYRQRMIYSSDAKAASDDALQTPTSWHLGPVIVPRARRPWRRAIMHAYQGPVIQVLVFVLPKSRLVAQWSA